ncbi:unnamed protein product [Amaranthus hypochondriacus]
MTQKTKRPPIRPSQGQPSTKHEQKLQRPPAKKQRPPPIPYTTSPKTVCRFQNNPSPKKQCPKTAKTQIPLLITFPIMSLEVDLRRIVKPDVGPTCSFTTTSQSSSIGQPDLTDDDDDDDDDDEEVQSSLSSLTSLEDSLPIKRKGLSNFYTGKSKSYGNLTQVRNVKELEKSDNPFNKRKRTLMAYNLMFKTNNNNLINKKKKSGTGLFYSHSNHISMPILPLSQLDDHDQDQDHDHDHHGGVLDQE